MTRKQLFHGDIVDSSIFFYAVKLVTYTIKGILCNSLLNTFVIIQCLCKIMYIL